MRRTRRFGKVASTAGAPIGSRATSYSKGANSYAWSILAAPVGSRASWSIGAGPTTTLVAPTFVPDIAGIYQVGLVVSDGTLASAQLVVQVEL